MDVDTIFPPVSIGEEIQAKYRYSRHCGLFQTVSTLTNLRLLIRWRSGCCSFCSRSAYSSISLQSIHRVDEFVSHPRSFMIIILILLVSSGFGALVFIGLVDGRGGQYRWMVPLWVINFLVTIAALAYLCLSCRRRYVKLQGTFGTLILQLTKDSSRELVGRINEMIYHRKMKRTLQQVKWYYQTNLSVISSPVPLYYTESEKRTSRNRMQYLPQ